MFIVGKSFATALLHAVVQANDFEREFLISTATGIFPPPEIRFAHYYLYREYHVLECPYGSGVENFYRWIVQERDVPLVAIPLWYQEQEDTVWKW